MFRACHAWAGVAVALLAVLTPVLAGAATSTAPVGNVTPNTLPAPGRVAAVATSAPVDGRVAVLVQNGTSSPARVDLVIATSTRSDGGSTTRARSVKAYPQVLASGELALAAVQFRKRDIALGATVSVTVRSTKVSTARVARGLSVIGPVLSAPQTGHVAQSLEATLTNGSASWTARSPEAAVMCFGEAGTPTTFAHARTPTRRIAPGKSAPVSVPFTSLCPSYLVAGRAA